MKFNLSQIKSRVFNQGFTLIEMVMVVVLLGVISLGVVRYLTVSVESYMDVNNRTQMAQTGRFVIERLNREIRTALPGSVRVWTSGAPEYHCLEFIPVAAVTSYHALPVASAAPQFNISAFDDPDPNPGAIPATDFTTYNAGVYNLDSCDVYGVDSAGNNCGSARWFSLDDVSGYDDTVSGTHDDDGILTLEFDPVVQYPSESQAKRVYLFQTPVAFCLQQGSDRLTRHQGYAFSYRHAMATPPANGVLLADGITYSTDTFAYNLANHVRSAAVELELVLNRDDEAITFNHEVTLLHAP